MYLTFTRTYQTSASPNMTLSIKSSPLFLDRQFLIVNIYHFIYIYYTLYLTFTRTHQTSAAPNMTSSIKSSPLFLDRQFLIVNIYIYLV